VWACGGLLGLGDAFQDVSIARRLLERVILSGMGKESRKLLVP